MNQKNESKPNNLVAIILISIILVILGAIVLGTIQTDSKPRGSTTQPILYTDVDRKMGKKVS